MSVTNAQLIIENLRESPKIDRITASQIRCWLGFEGVESTLNAIVRELKDLDDRAEAETIAITIQNALEGYSWGTNFKIWEKVLDEAWSPNGFIMLSSTSQLPVKIAEPKKETPESYLMVVKPVDDDIVVVTEEEPVLVFSPMRTAHLAVLVSRPTEEDEDEEWDLV